MPIHTQCEHCGFDYISKDEMAGKKVRCRNCGQVFAIPGQAHQADGSLDAPGDAFLADLDETGDQADGGGGGAPEVPQNSSAETKKMPALSTTQSNMTGGEGSAKSRMERGADPGSFEMAGAAPGPSLRPSTPFVFPHANDLDAWAPRLLPLLVLFWLFYVLWSWSPSLIEPNERHPAWAGLIPIAMLLVALCAIWLPLFAGAMRNLASAKKFALPHRTLIRAFCLASLPFALGGVFWLAGDSLITMGIGLFLGLAIAVPAAWFLYRLKETEIAPAAISLALATIFSTALTMGLLWGGNFALNKALNETGKGALFAASPVGPNLTWEVRREPAPAPKPTTTRSASTTVVPAIPPAVAPSGTPPAFPAPVATAPIRPADPVVRTPPPPVVNVTPIGPTPPAATPTEVDMLANHPVLSDGSYLPIAQGALEVIYPLMPSNFMAVVNPAADADTQDVRLYSIEPFAAQGRATLASSVAKSGYALSPDGQLLARVSHFGNGSTIQIWSFAKGAITANHALGPIGSEPRLVGFLDNNTLLCEWRNLPGGSTYELSALDLSTKQFTPYANSIEQHSYVVAIMPDAKSVAAVGTAADDLLSLRFWQPKQRDDRTNRPSRIFLVQTRNTAFLSPAGIAPNADGTQLAIAYQDGGQLQLLICNREDRKGPVQQHILPGGLGLRALPPNEMNPGNRLTWLPGGDLVIYTQLTINAATGKVIGTIGEGPIVNQKLVNDTTMHFVVGGPSGLRVLQTHVRPLAAAPK